MEKFIIVQNDAIAFTVQGSKVNEGTAHQGHFEVLDEEGSVLFTFYNVSAWGKADAIEKWESMK